MGKMLLMVACIVLSGLSNVSCKKTDTKIDENIVIATGEKKPVETPAEALTATGKIDRDVKKINDATLTKRTYTYQCDEKITIDYYTQDGTLFKVAIDYGYVGDGHNIREYYYESGNVIYMYDFYEGGPACEGCMVTTIKKSYVNNNTIIKHLENDKETQCKVCKLTDRDLAYTIVGAQKTQDFKTLLCS